MTTYYVVQKRMDKLWDDWDDLGSNRKEAVKRFRLYYFTSKADVGAFRLVKKEIRLTRVPVKFKEGV